MKKRLLSLFCAAALLAGLMPTAAFAGTDTGKAIQLVDSGTAANIGGGQADNIYFGTYQQSNAGSEEPDGTEGVDWINSGTATYKGQGPYYYIEPVKWRVLSNANGQLFLLSDQNLDVFQYHTDYESVTWETSTMRSWLNGYGASANTGGDSGTDYTNDNFIDTAFSSGEQGAIAQTYVYNATQSDGSSNPNPSYGTSGGENTTDKIFLLSIEETNNSGYCPNENSSRISTNTAYVTGGGKTGSYNMSDVGEADYWWLRSPGDYAYYAAFVNDIGGVYSIGKYVNYAYFAVRPAFHLDLNSVLFTSAAVGGKIPAAGSGGNQGAVGADAIFEIGAYTGNEWKLTLLDSSRNFSISDAKIEESQINFSYSNAQTGPNEYISVVIEDEGEITHYGRILQLGGASGTASLTLPAGVTLDDDIKLYVFNEQYNGGENDDTKRTDYGSALIEVNPTVDDTAPTLSGGSATRTSETTATVKFTSDEAGEYFYEVVESGTTAPTINTAGTGTSCASGENTISLTSLSDAGAKDIYIVAKDAVGNVSSSLKIEIHAYIAPVYAISADTQLLDFGTVTEGYTQAPAAKTVTITNTGNQNVTVNLPTSTNYIITAGTGFTSGNAALSPDGEAQFTVQPKTGLGVGDYTDKLSITGAYGVRDDVELRFVVVRQSGGSSSGGSSTPTKTPSQQATDKINAAKDGETVEITLKTGQTTLDREVFEALAGRDVTLVIHLDDEVDWTINGQDIPADAVLTDLDMGVSMGTSTIPVDIINAITGEATTMQLTLAHDGAFGFTLTLTAPLGKEYANLWANLYHYDAGALKFEAAARIGRDGTVSLPFTHASEYAIIIDDRDHTPKAFPFVDVKTSDWYYDAVDYAYQNELMNGTSAYLFEPDGTMTRAMLVTILHRQAGEPVVNYALPFDDVAEGTWYTEAVRWAAAEGIVTGTSATTFAPDAPVTREQFATILYRYAQQSGADVSVGEDTNILSYADALEISEYAIPAMQWACGAGVVQGSGANLNPQSSATRAEAAAMLMRFIQTAAE